MAVNEPLSPSSVKSAIKALEREIDERQQRKALLEQFLALQGKAPARRPGRPRGSRRTTAPAPAAAKKTASRAGRRPKGESLREVILTVLSKAKGPVRAKDLRDKVVAAGYQTSATSQSLYTSVFTTASKLDGVTRSKAGFALASAKSAVAKPVTPRKKRGVKNGNKTRRATAKTKA